MFTKDITYVKEILEKILKTPSPSGYCFDVMELIQNEMDQWKMPFKKTRKGNGLIELPFEGDNDTKLLVSAHLDTLGAMVRSIKPDGKLRLTSIGGFSMHSIEGEYCLVHTRDGQKIPGTILTSKPSVHVYKEARNGERKEEEMEVRLDKSVTTKKETLELGIQVGDYISFDPRVSITKDGFIKSRHLDDKAGVAVIMGAIKYITDNKLPLKRPVQVMFSTYEEVGHGSSYIPADITEVLAVDMGAIGDDLTCTEKDVSICVKDSSGPYDYEMVGELIHIAKEQELQYSLDVYPYYSSDASAALLGGSNIRTALIGPGIHASHTMERTHEESLLNAMNLIIGYLIRE